MHSLTHYALLISALSLTTLSATTDKCPCGYIADGKVYTDLQETDFTTVTNLLGPASGWQLQEYAIPSNIERDQPFARDTSRDNVILTKDGVQLVVRPAKDKVVSGAELVTPRGDIHYGSFRVGMKGSSVSGTCAAFFWYHSDAREIDIELLSREVDTRALHGKANLVIHSNSSQAAGYDASGTRTFIKQDLAFDPTLTFHEYRMDWGPDRVNFFIDGTLVKIMMENIPNDPGRLFLNHWSNGSPGWSGGPPLADSILTVLYVKAYFNSSDPGRVAAASQRCAGSSGTVCPIPDQGSYQGGDGSSTSSPSAGPPRPGRVPFLSADPQNVVGQETYNATYSCEGCPSGKKKSTASSFLRNSPIGYAIWYGWIIFGVLFVLR